MHITAGQSANNSYFSCIISQAVMVCRILPKYDRIIIPSAKLSDNLPFLPRRPHKSLSSERRSAPQNAVHSNLLSPIKDEGALAARPEMKEWLRISQYASTVRSPRTCRAAKLWFFHLKKAWVGRALFKNPYSVWGKLYASVSKWKVWTHLKTKRQDWIVLFV